MAAAKLGVDKTVEVIDDLKNISLSVISIAKKKGAGGVLGSFKDGVKIVEGLVQLVKDIPGALPELKDLDAAECAVIGQASYGLVKGIIDAVLAKG